MKITWEEWKDEEDEWCYNLEFTIEINKKEAKIKDPYFYKQVLPDIFVVERTAY